jgi:hypothetical protein
LPELAEGECKTPAALAALLRHDDQAAVRAILQALDRTGVDEQTRSGSERSVRADLLLVVDQLDDVFAADVPAEERTAFAKMLRALVASGRVWVVATLRAVLYERFLEESDLKALKDAGADYDLASPGPVELAEIVRRPAAAAGLLYETNAAGETLDQALLRDAAGTDTLPLLQFTLQHLFAERQLVGAERRLTFAACRALGGISGAIDQAAERALAEPGVAEALPRLLRRLTVPVPATANAAGRSALAIRAATLAEAAPDAATRRLVDALVEARILLHSKERGVPTIRLAHDRVLESWRRARELAAGNFDFFRIRDELEEQRRRWEASGRKAALLLPRGLPLAQAEQFIATYGAELDAPIHGFVAASGRHARLRQRLATLAAAVLAAVAVVAGWQYFAARAAMRAAEQTERIAVAERDRTEQQRQLAEGQQRAAEQQRQLAQDQQRESEAQRRLAQDRQKEAEEQRGIAQKRQEEAASQRSLAENRRKEVEEQRNQALVAQSRFLADLADQKLKAGDDITAALLALEALPNAQSAIARPLVTEPQLVLERALRPEGDERARVKRRFSAGIPMRCCPAR